MYRLKQLFHQEPAVIAGVITAGVGLAVQLGLPLTNDQVASLVQFVALGLAVFYVRPKVTPTGGPQ